MSNLHNHFPPNDQMSRGLRGSTPASDMYGNMPLGSPFAQDTQTPSFAYRNPTDTLIGQVPQVSTYHYNHRTMQTATPTMQYNSVGNDVLDLQSVLRSRNQELEEKLRSSQQELQHWKDAYMMLLPRIGPPNNQSATLSPIIPTAIKPEFTMLSMPPKKLEPDASHMSPAEFIQTRNELLRALFDLAFVSHENHDEKERYDYIYVQFWTFKDYDDNAKDNKEDNTLSDKIAYLEDIKGKSVDMRRVKTIRSELRGIFKHIFNNLPRAIEATWTRYDTFFQDTVYKHLRTKYPEFMLCEDNWKARSFMSNWYSNWMKNLKKAKPGTQDTEKGNDRTITKTIPAKRHIANDPIPSTSKQPLSNNEIQRASYTNEDPPPSTVVSNCNTSSRVQILSPLILKPRNLPNLNLPIPDLTDDSDGDIMAPTSIKSPLIPVNSHYLAEIDLTTSVDSVTENVTDTTPVNSVLATDTYTPSASTAPAPLRDLDMNSNGISQSLSLSFDAAHSLLTATQSVSQQEDSGFTECHNANNENVEGTVALANAMAKGKKDKAEHKKRVNPKSTTAENLFAIEFQKLHNGKGTVAQFNAAWNALSMPEKIKYQEQSATLVAEVRQALQSLQCLIRLTANIFTQKKASTNKKQRRTNKRAEEEGGGREQM